MQTISILAREHYDGGAGNSYFAARVFIDDELIFKLPYQYGYDSQYIYEAGEELVRRGLIDKKKQAPLWRWARDNNVKLFHSIDKGYKRKQVEEYGSD